MMKRLICLLVTLLLPCFAVAEGAWEMHVTWQADADAANAYLTKKNGEDSMILAAGMAELVNNLKVSLLSQQNGFQADVLYADESILSMGAFSKDDAGYAVSSLWPGYVLQVDVKEVDRAVDAWLAGLMKLDWQQFYLALKEESLSRWMISLEGLKEQGSFSGDAYEGGVRRESILFDDRDFALLVDEVLFALESFLPVDEAIVSMLGGDPYEALRALNHDVAMDNRYDYVLRRVSDLQDADVGYSLTVLENGSQVATLSLGMLEDGVHLVWGYGMNQQNYYLDALFTCKERHCAAEVQILRDSTHAGYQAAQQMTGQVVASFTANACMQQGDDGAAAVQGEIILSMPEMDVENRYVCQAASSEESFCGTVEWYAGGMEKPCAAMRVEAAPVAPVSFDQTSLTPFYVDDENAMSDEALMTVVQQASTELGIKLFKILPPQLFVMMN